MTYKFKRALAISVVLYIATFIVGIICGVILGHDPATMAEVPDSFWYIGMVGAIVLTALFAGWYFKSSAIKASAKSGLFFGLTAAAVSFILDYVIFSLGSSDGVEFDFGSYYGDVRYWIIIMLVIATAKVFGWRKGKQIA